MAQLATLSTKKLQNSKVPSKANVKVDVKKGEKNHSDRKQNQKV